ESGDRVVVQVALPVEGRGAVVGEHLIGVVGLDRFGEGSGGGEVGCAGLHPQQVRVGRVGLRAGDARFQAVPDPVVAFGGALAGEEGPVVLVHIGGEQCGGLGVGAGDDERGDAFDVGGEAGGAQRAQVLGGGHEHFAAEVPALLLGGELVLPVDGRGTGGDHGLHELVGVERAAEARFGVGDDGDEPVVDGGGALGELDLVGAHEGVVDAADDLRDGVRRVQ